MDKKRSSATASSLKLQSTSARSSSVETLTEKFARSAPAFLKSVAILSPGLIGGSLALALRARCPQVDIRIWARRESALFEVVERLECFASQNLEPVVSGADAVVFCMPVDAIESIALNCVPYVAKDALVTDVCSVKRPVVECLEPIFGERFIGAHPMAGGEQAGLIAAREDLFDRAICLLTPTVRTSAEFISKGELFWSLVGCQTEQLSPEEHDLAIGYISHLPHAVAAMVVEAVRRRQPAWQELSGPGYRDTTRVAAGSSDLWRGILLANRAAVLEALRDFIQLSEEFAGLIEHGDGEGVAAFLEGARSLRLRGLRDR